MWRRLWQSAVIATVIVSFMLVAVHAYLLHETPSQQRDCPVCQWLQNLALVAAVAVLVVGVLLIGRASLGPLAVVLARPHHRPFLARSPPSR